MAVYISPIASITPQICSEQATRQSTTTTISERPKMRTDQTETEIPAYASRGLLAGGYGAVGTCPTDDALRWPGYLSGELRAPCMMRIGGAQCAPPPSQTGQADLPHPAFQSAATDGLA